ncbi:hypothetical protein T03_11028 [Trichinella britovi]|uniref:Uncharacterized protein n=1 Tax=Trichinella britovi TaxID=45882 RepID=A0A0V0Z066_TRIBR|nr:hypothetical protein T03_11028 [Trichinella britovi]
MLGISRFQSQLTGFPMYHLAEVEVSALYPRIRKVALNRRYQGCLKITDIATDCWHQFSGRKGMDGK